jgi:TRAP-type C4-dicarboxylate transport system permease small subunit
MGPVITILPWKRWLMIKAISNTLDIVLISIAAVVLGVDVLITVFSIILGAFGISNATLHELPRLSMSCVAFLGLGAALKAGQHVSVDFLFVLLKGRIRTTLEALIYMIICVAVVFLFWASLDTMLWLKIQGKRFRLNGNFPFGISISFSWLALQSCFFIVLSSPQTG